MTGPDGHSPQHEEGEPANVEPEELASHSPQELASHSPQEITSKTPQTTAAPVNEERDSASDSDEEEEAPATPGQVQQDRIWSLGETLEEAAGHSWQSEEDDEEQEDSEIWGGNNLNKKHDTTGARAATINTARKFYADEENWETIYFLMVYLEIDILVITEPGKSDEMRMAAVKSWAIEKGMSADIVNRNHRTTAGGLIVLTAASWSGITRKVHMFTPKVAEKDRLMAIEYDNGMEGEHNKMMLIAYYGLNAAHTKKAELKEMHAWIWKTKSSFLRKNWQAPVILAGDLNAAQTTMYDTDRLPLVHPCDLAAEEDMEMEEDSGTIDHLQDMGLHDALRATHPDTRFATRKTPLGGDVRTLRYLDRVLVTSQLRDHRGTKVGIYKKATFVDDTDHYMVVADLPVDLAAVAKVRAQLWNPNKTTTQQWDADHLGNMDPKRIDQFNVVAEETWGNKRCDASTVTAWLKEAGRDTVLKTVVREYPRKVRKLKDFQKRDWAVKRNAKLIQEAARRIEQYETMGAALPRLAKLKDVPDTPHANIKDELSQERLRDQSRDDIIRMLDGCLMSARTHLAREARKSRAQQIKDNVNRRNERFRDSRKKKMRAVITSIMRRARIGEQIVAQQRNEAAGVATEMTEVAREVVAFYKRWMASRVPWEKRWKSWEGMMALDTTELVNKDHSEFIESAYRESFVKYGKLQEEEGFWNSVWEQFDMDDIRVAMQKFKSGKSGGPTGVTYDLIKALDDTNLGPVLGLMQDCLEKRQLPRELNKSMIRALPKTENGLADLNLTRPIALMEVLGKLFERLLFNRIVKILADKEMLDMSQHGGMKDRGSADPIRVLAEAMEDAQESGQELHLFSADLTKAFDTLEYWSQAMSWRALGMPEDMAVMLMNMDKEGESEVILGQGRTTSSVLGEDGWFNSGRGVRQGSIGGPIKWIVYMNFWLKYVNKKHGDEGYAMSEDSSTVLRAQMFVDDSNWAARSVESMTAMIDSNTTFVDFHGLSFNRKKCEYIVMNQELGEQGQWARPTWPDGTMIMESIRVTGDQEPRRATEEQSLLATAEKTLRQVVLNTTKENVAALAQTQWDQIQQNIEEAATEWRTGATDAWWAGDNAWDSDGHLTAAVQAGRGVGTWGPSEGAGAWEATQEAEEAVTEWKATTRRAIALNKRNKAMRYLGVWFEGDGKWRKQRQLLEAKFKDLNDRISRSSPTREQAIYCINATINTALKFPLQIAHVPKAVLEEWDRRNRQTVRKAGYLPVATPVDLIHLPKKEGGLGLERLATAVGRTHIATYVTLLNTESLAADMTRAGRKRALLRGGSKESLHKRIEDELEKRGMCITESREQGETAKEVNEYFKCSGEQAHIDIAEAYGVQRTGKPWSAYGDGSTYEDRDRAGWGLWMTDNETDREGKGRMCGKQSNDGAEAMAILKTMLMTHPEDDLMMYCDNQGCVYKWRKLGREKKIQWGFRAIWCRIHHLLAERQLKGSNTEVVWVHSHVDDENRRADKNGVMTCACREDGQEECDPRHRHHKGNDRADIRAKHGAEQDKDEEREGAARGELWFILHDSTGIAQGEYKKWLMQRETQRLLSPADEEEEEDTESEKTLDWVAAAQRSDRKLRKSILRKLDKTGSTSWRFWSRLMCRTLPTYARMIRFANSTQDNAYRTVYGTELGPQGRCISCGEDHETVEHAVWSCRRAEGRWNRTFMEIEDEWEQRGASWCEHDWVTTPESWEGWQRGWALAGLVPAGVVAAVVDSTNLGYVQAYVLVRDTAWNILSTAEATWKMRVEAAQTWEKENGTVAENKTHMKRTQWSRRGKPKRAPRTKGTKRKQKDAEVEERARHREEARLRERRRVDTLNANRYSQGQVPMRRAKAQEMIDAAGEAADKTAKTRLLKRRNLAEIAEGSAQLPAVTRTIAEVQRDAPRNVTVPRQFGQRGMWFPDRGTRVDAFWIDPEGSRQRGGATGSIGAGKVTALAWEAEGNPEFEVTYEDDSTMWHGVADEAGTTITMRDFEIAATERIPDEFRELLGHGTKMDVEWIGRITRRKEWHRGQVVALSEEKGIAIRYGTASNASVAWHTAEDLTGRGYAVTTARRRGRYTNDQFQRESVNMAKGCLLLTDRGECGCHWCGTRGWPRQILETEMTEPHLDLRGLETMQPAAGRWELNNRRQLAAEQQKGKEKQDLRQRRKDQRKASESLAAENKKQKLDARNTDHQNEQDRSGEQHRGPDQEGNGDTNKQQDSEGNPKKARRKGNQKQRRSQGSGPRTRSQGLGMAGQGAQGEQDDTQADNGMDERVDWAGGTQDQQPESGCGVGDGPGEEEGAGGEGGQGGGDGSTEGMDAHERGTRKRNVPGSADREKGSDAIKQVEPVQKVGRSGGLPRDPGNTHCTGGNSHGDEQGSGRDERSSEELADGLPDVGGEPAVAHPGGKRIRSGEESGAHAEDDEGARADREREQERVQRQGGQKPGGSGTGQGDSNSSLEPIRLGPAGLAAGPAGRRLGPAGLGLGPAGLGLGPAGLRPNTADPVQHSQTPQAQERDTVLNKRKPFATGRDGRYTKRQRRGAERDMDRDCARGEKEQRTHRSRDEDRTDSVTVLKEGIG